jgi:ketosteroid isomerase-like protein
MAHRKLANIAYLICLLPLSIAGCSEAPTNDANLPTAEWRQAVRDTLLDLVSASQSAYESGNCDQIASLSWLPENPPIVFFAAGDQVIRLDTHDQVASYCERLASRGGSMQEVVQEQTVNTLSLDGAYVVTQSLQSTQWPDGRVDARRWVETAVMSRQGGRWRLVYKHLSWGDTAQARGP